MIERCVLACGAGMKFGDYPKVASFDGVAGFRAHLASLGLEMPCDDIVAAGASSPLAAAVEMDGLRIGGRLAINPMEGWDGGTDGSPSDNTIRRWRRFGSSGAKLIWGGEAVAVSHGARANPNQLVIAPHTHAGLARLRAALLEGHREATGSAEAPLIGLQL